MSQSRSFTDYQSTIEIKQGTDKRVDLVMDIDLSSKMYDGATFKAWKPDGTLIVEVSIHGSVENNTNFIDVNNNLVSILIPAQTDVGNWEAEVEFHNEAGEIINHSQTFNFNILRSF